MFIPPFVLSRVAASSLGCVPLVRVEGLFTKMPSAPGTGGCGRMDFIPCQGAFSAEPWMQISRRDLYQRVWHTPIRILAKEFDISDVGLSKACRKHGVPTPPVG